MMGSPVDPGGGGLPVPVPVADGGTGAGTAAGARTALGLAIGSDVEAWSGRLDDLAGFIASGGDAPLFIFSDGSMGEGGAADVRAAADLDTTDSPTWAGGTFTANLRVKGNFTVDGETQTTASELIRIDDNYLALNSDYTAAVAQDGGLVINYLPTATATTVAAPGFVAGVAGVSNPTVTTVGAATFAAGDVVQISGAGNENDNGLFEVLTHAAGLLTVRGVGLTATVESFARNQFVTSATVAGALTKVNVAALRADTGGAWEVAVGATVPLTWRDLVLTDDSRLSDARTPTAHASTHEPAGSDQITAAIRALNLAFAP